MASTTADPSTAPVAKAARIESLDILRGVAVFGILMMNITAFGLLFQAYDNPTVDGGATGINLIVYKIINLGFEGTMRGIFSLLFGAGIVLLTQRMENAGAGIMAADVHFRRMLWMLLAGVIHWALLLWTGEILFAYAICGLVLFSFRKLNPRVQLGIAAVLLVLASAASLVAYYDAVETHAIASAAEAAKAEGATLTKEQETAIEDWAEELLHTEATPESITLQRDWRSGSYFDAVVGQLPFSFEFQWVGLPLFFLFDMVPFMLIGMALLKLQVLDATRPLRVYLAMVAVGYAIGLPLGWFELGTILGSNFSRLGFFLRRASRTRSADWRWWSVISGCCSR